jgi:hypothetical protein
MFYFPPVLRLGIPGDLGRRWRAAIDHGVDCPATDRRGVAQPQGSACDIGAVEVTVDVLGNGNPTAMPTATLGNGNTTPTTTPSNGDPSPTVARGR